MAKFLRPNKASLKNAQHFEFIDAFITVLAGAGLSAAKIVALLAELRTAFSEEDRLYMIARASEIIARRVEADRSRDDMYNRLRDFILVWFGSGHPTHDAAATALKRPFDLYKVKTAAQIDEESGQMDNLITDLSAQEMQAHLQTLGAQWLFEQMVGFHQQVKSLRLEQGAKESEKSTLKAARQKCDDLYDKITYLIEAFALTADDPAPYEAFTKRWNGTLKLYQDMLDRKSGTTSSGGSGNNNNGANTPTPTPTPSGGGSDQGGDTPGGETPGGDEPGGDTPAGDTPGGGDTPGSDTPGGGDTPGSDTPPTGDDEGDMN